MSHTPEGQLFTDIVLEVFKLSGLLALEGDRITDEFGLSSARWKVLGALSFSPSPMTVPQIAAAMGQARQGVQRPATAARVGARGKFEAVDVGLRGHETGDGIISKNSSQNNVMDERRRLVLASTSAYRRSSCPVFRP